MAVDLEYYGVPAADYREQENRTRLTASAGQTTFSAPYSVGYVDVYFNGAKLDPFTEFTGTDGANIVLASAASVGDIVEVISRAQVQIANVYTQQQVNALLVPYFGVSTGTGDAQIAVTTPTFTSFVDGMDIKIRTVASNTITAPTITLNGLAPKTIVSNAGGSALLGSDWFVNSEITLRYNQTLDKMVLVDGMANALPQNQFNNSNRYATTGFVQRALGNFQTVSVITNPTTLTQSQTGSFLEIGGTFTSGTITLPAPTSNVGTTYTFYNAVAGSNVTLSTPSGLIYCANTGTSTYSLISGASIQLVCDGASWLILSGQSAALVTASNGYQRFPSGYIRQWGFGTLPASGTNVASVAVSFPVSFPGGIKSIVCTAVGTANSSAGYSPIMRASSGTTNGFTASGDLNGSATTFNQTCLFYWQADGN
jgi:hypothetical protein